MGIIKCWALILVVFILSGCSNGFDKYMASYVVGTGNDLSYSKDAFKKSDITYSGIPTIFGVGFQGTTFPVTPHYSLTALHVAKVTFNKVVAYNEECDVALIKHNNKGEELPVLSDVYLYKDLKQRAEKSFVKTYGYSRSWSLPVESSGEVMGNFYLRGEDSKMLCTMLTSTSGGKPGMSGGPVYNQKDQVVGVLNRELFQVPYYDEISKKYYTKDVKYTVFTPMQEIIGWLQKSLDKTEDKGFLKVKMTDYVPVPPINVIKTDPATVETQK